MAALQESFDSEFRIGDLVFLFRIISCNSWDELQGWCEAVSRSCVEHVLYGVYAPTVLPDEARGIVQ